jgi:hypothetical protein
MPEQEVPESRTTVTTSEINWSGVILGALLLAVLVIAINNPIFRALAALVALGITLYASLMREEREIENPLLHQVRQTRPGLDRRKYGRLRSNVDDLLERVREMNRIAVDARSGKVSQRHAQAELERQAKKIHDLVADIRKSAGVPTPVEETTPRTRRPPRPPGGGSGST